ncbi:MAG: tetraacyldisaccharide 4'-kinase [Bacteroidetes bacterium]|nr:MAG: tetraacyldisaccharide 4'-kinase [Bacteroidota bacterium]
MLQLLSKIYGSIVNARNKKFDEHTSEIVKCNVPVISVGNLTTGGTGKTPFVIFLANMLLESGIRPVIIGRGYKKKRKGYVLVSDGKYVIDNPDLAGDEMFLIAKKVNAPVVAHESKSEAAQIAERHISPDVILIDDGFQHRRLLRDIDILLINNKTLTEQNLLPAGHLREPLSSASRADVIIEIGTIDDDTELRIYLQGKPKIFKANIVSDNIKNLNGVKVNNDNIDKIKQNSIAVSGIANPERFLQSLTNDGFEIIKHITFRDHKRYSQPDIDLILTECKKVNINNIIVTEKDAVKLTKFKSIFENNNVGCYIYPIEIEITENFNEFRNYIKSKIQELRKHENI